MKHSLEITWWGILCKAMNVKHMWTNADLNNSKFYFITNTDFTVNIQNFIEVEKEARISLRAAQKTKPLF